MKTNETVVMIDGQVFQSGAWHRGMGKYSHALLKEVYPLLNKDNDVKLILNKNLTIEKQAKKSLEAIFSNKNIIYLDLALASKNSSKDITANKRIINEYVKQYRQYKSIKYFILSLFLDNGCAVFPDKSDNYLLFYDAIPFLFHDKYKDRINFDNYLTHYKTVFEADYILAISQTVADDLVLTFGVDSDRVVNINGARIGNKIANPEMPNLLDGVGKFVLCPSGDELRKNNTRAVQGFDLFNKKHDSKYTLVLTSFFSEYTKDQLSAISDKVLFTGNVPIEQLEWLYLNCDLVLFPSEYEGLGLPILEAVTYGKKIACSDISVFNEISTEEFYFFDPRNPLDISKTIGQAIQDIKQPSYSKIDSKYTWHNTSKTTFDTITKSPISKSSDSKPKLAIVCPKPDGYSAIGKVVSESHYEFAKYFDITYFYDWGPEHTVLRPEVLSKVSKHFNIDDFNQDIYNKFDAVIYHIGNSEYHLKTIANALVRPGYCIFHDSNLSGAYNLLRSMGLMTSERYALEQALDEKLDTKKGKFLTTIANKQLHNFVHSNYARDAIKETGCSSVTKVNLPVAVPKHLANRKKHKFTVGLAGIIAGIKGIELVERISQEMGSDINIVIFGYLQSDVLKNQLKKIQNVTIVTNPTDFEFQNQLARLDVLLNYRMKYQGETSLTVLEAMRYGVVSVVRDIGWYSELPDNSVVKVTSIEEAVKAIDELLKNRDLLIKIGDNAIDYVKKYHSHSKYCNVIYQIINKNE